MTFKTMRCGELKCKSIDVGYNSYYEDLQKDYKINIWRIIPFLGIGYGTRTEDDVITYCSPEQAEQAIEKMNVRWADNFSKYVKLLVGPQTKASSCYAIFSTNYEPNEKAKYGQERVGFFQKLKETKATSKAIKGLLSSSNPQYAKIAVSEWLKIRHRLIKSEDVKSVWDSIAGELKDGSRSIGHELRKHKILQCQRPDDHKYCVILTEMIRKQAKSYVEKYQQHIGETSDFEATLAEIKMLIFDLILELSNALDSKNYGLHKNVLLGSLQCIKTQQFDDDAYQVATDELKQPKYQSLIDADAGKLLQAMKALKLYKKLTHRKLYPVLPQVLADSKVPFGLTGRGSFSLASSNDSIDVTINNSYKLRCYHSNYFGELCVTSKKNVYEIEFAHKTNLRGRTPEKVKSGPKIKGLVKEIGVLKHKDGFYYISLQYDLQIDQSNSALGLFFKTANPSDEQNAALPNKFRVAGIDLNISNPLCVAKADVQRNGKGEIDVLDFGKASLIGSPKAVFPDTELGRSLVTLREKCRNVQFFIREYKAAKFAGKFVSDAVKKDILNDVKHVKGLENYDLYSLTGFNFLIRMLVHSLKLDIRRLAYQHQHGSVNDLGQSIRLLEARDRYQSMIAAYERIHLEPGETLPFVAKNSKKRINFRKDILRKLAAALVEHTKDCQIVFLEDLESKYDRDNDNNAITRLFSAQTAIKYIEEALTKRGIAVVSVDKRGTSKSDPQTGCLGWRPKTRAERVKCGGKHKLYVVRGKKLGWIDSDLAASINVLIRGLNRSIVPYKWYHAKTADTRKRLPVFLTKLFGKAKVNFKEQGSELVQTASKKNGYTGYVYYRNGKFLTFSQHRAIEESLKTRVIKHLDVAGPNPPQFNLTGGNIKAYSNFCLS